MNATAQQQQPGTVRTQWGEFVVYPSRVVFDEHTEYSRKGELLRSFDRDTLQEIASACNERDAKGAWCPLTRGHMVRDQYDDNGVLLRAAREDEQPDTLGYARNFQVAQGADGKFVITADYYLRPDRYQEALTYPRTSVELWPQRVFDPIALLRRTPRLDIPQWTYSRSSFYPERPETVLRYSREDSPMGPVAPGPMNAMPGGAPGGAGAGGGGDMSQKLESYMRHCASHQYARELMDHYGGAGGGGAEPPPAPGGAGAGAPLGGEPPMGGPPQPFSRDSEIAALQRKIASLEAENRHELRRKDLTALAEVVELDVDEELTLLGDLAPALYQRELTRIRNRYARKDVGGMVPTLGEPEPDPAARDGHAMPYARAATPGNRFVQNGTLTKDGAKAIQKFADQYRREHPDATWEEVRDVYIREQTAASTPTRNGR